MNLKNKALLVVGLYLFLSLTGCKSGEFLEPRQNVALAKGIRQAMSKDQVLIVMKEPPISIDYAKDVVEWHYCDSDTWDGSPHKFVAVYFINERVATVATYRASSLSGARYSCLDHVKGGDYSEPAVIQEYREGRL
jgi:hypothetical protein